jgi:hypothetical protein
MLAQMADEDDAAQHSCYQRHRERTTALEQQTAACGESSSRAAQLAAAEGKCEATRASIDAILQGANEALVAKGADVKQHLAAALAVQQKLAAALAAASAENGNEATVGRMLSATFVWSAFGCIVATIGEVVGSALGG